MLLEKRDLTKIQCGIRKTVMGLHTGIDGYRRCGIHQNTVRDSENVNGIRELNATGVAGLTKIWALMWDGKENYVRESDERNWGFGIFVMRVRDTAFS